MQIGLTALDTEYSKISLECVNFNRMEKAVKKYAQLQSNAKWMKRLKYAGIGAGCAGVAALLLKFWFASAHVTPAKQEKDSSSSKFDEHELAKRTLEHLIKTLEAEEKRKTFKGGLRKSIDDSIYFVIGTIFVGVVFAIINKSYNALNCYFDGLDPQDPEIYKQKHDNINVLIKRLGSFLFQHKHDLDTNFSEDSLFDLKFADILINHTMLVRWFEDFIGFIKCAVISVVGDDSLELVCLEKDIIVLSQLLDIFTDKASLFINSTEEDRGNLLKQVSESYMIFCKQFSKFIYDCGFYLYDQDFLRF